MDEAIVKLRGVSKGERVVNGNVVIGKAIQCLLEHMLVDGSVMEDSLEQVLLDTMKANGREFCAVAGRTLGLCFVEFYKKKSVGLWTFLSVVSTEIGNENLPAIIVLGIVAKHIGDRFKSQLPVLVSKLLVFRKVKTEAHVCQCFRRILKGTRGFLTESIGEMCTYVMMRTTSASEQVRVECTKTIPVLVLHGKVELQRFLPTIGLVLPAPTQVLKYVAAKAMAKLAFKFRIDSGPFEGPIKFLLQFVAEEKNVKAVSGAFVILMRFYDPIEVIRCINEIAKCTMAMSKLRVSLETLVLLTTGIIDGVVKCTGETIHASFCAILINDVGLEMLTMGRAMIVITAINRIDLPAKNLAGVVKVFHHLLTSDRKELVYSVGNIFATMAKSSARVGEQMFKTLLDCICDDDSLSVADFERFGETAVGMLLSSDLPTERILTASMKWLDEDAMSRKGIALLVLTAIYKRGGESSLSHDIIAVAMKNGARCVNGGKRKHITSFALFLSEVLLKSVEVARDYRDVYETFVRALIRDLSSYSSLTVLLFSRILKNAQFIWIDGNGDIPGEMARQTINVVNKKFDDAAADWLHPADTRVDLLTHLYGCGQARRVTNIYENIAGDSSEKSGTNTFRMLREVLNSFATWIAVADRAEKSVIIDGLFEGVKEKPLPSLALIRYLLTRRKIGKLLPRNGLPIFVSFETSKDGSMARYAASCAAKWVKMFPALAPSLLNYLDGPKRDPVFVAFVLGECARSIKDTTRPILQIRQLIQVSLLAAPLSALLKFLKYGKLEKEAIDVVHAILEECCYNDKLRSMPAMYLCAKCMEICPGFDQWTILTLLNFDTCSNFARHMGLGLVGKSSTSDSPYLKSSIEKCQNISKAPMLCVSSLHLIESIERAPIAFMLLQQTGSNSVSRSILHLARNGGDAKIWTSLCHRIIISKCVPPAERKGDLRVVPTRLVSVTAMQIAIMLVGKVRESLELECVDDLVSIAFTAIQMNDESMDRYGYSILAAVIRSFSPIRNREGSILNIYMAQFHPVLTHAFDGLRPVDTVADFCIAYVDFLTTSRNGLLDEALARIMKGLRRQKNADADAVVFCRLAACLRGSDVFSYVHDQFFAKADALFEDIAKQKANLSDLKEQMSDIAVGYLSISEGDRKVTNSMLLLLLLKEMHDSPSESVLLAVTNVVSLVGITEDHAAFALSVFHANVELFDKKRTVHECSVQSELDSDEFWVVSSNAGVSRSKFLTAIATARPRGPSWSYLLSISLLKPFCFATLARMFETADGDQLAMFGPSTLANVLEDSDACEAFCVVFFGKMHTRLGDDIVRFVVRSSLPLPRKLTLLRIALKRLNGYDITSLNDISDLLTSIDVSDALTFVSSLLVDPSTSASGLNLLPLGLLDRIVHAMRSSLRIVPRVTHFLSCCASATTDPGAQRTIAVLAFAILKLSSKQSDRLPVVSPICAILKNLDVDVLDERWFSEKCKPEILSCLRPPTSLSSAPIPLKLFATVSSTRSGGGWQDLETI